MILLLRIWQKMRAEAVIDAATEFSHVEKALHILQSLELQCVSLIFRLNQR